MSGALPAEVLEDDLAVSVARALATANRRVAREGVDVLRSLVTVTQHPVDGTVRWRVNCGPRDCVGRRSGDVVGEIAPEDERVTGVWRGQ